MEAEERPRVVIIGAGFGGLWAARTLADLPFDVLLVDRNNYHTFHALLYQVAAAELEPEGIAFPVRTITRSMPNVNFAMHDVQEIDFDARVVKAEEHVIPYDILVLAMGSTTNFFGVSGAAEHAFPLKSLEHAIALRNQILYCFELAAHEPDAEKRERLLTFIIVGGGPTGVEFAGALSELIHGPLRKDYPTLDFQEVRVVLLEGLDSLLPGLPESLRDYTLSRMHQMGVEVHLQAMVVQVTPEAVYLRDGTVIPTETVAWTAGVQGDPEIRRWDLPTAPNGRVAVLDVAPESVHDRTPLVIGEASLVEEATNHMEDDPPF